ncbi:MAG TPA: 6,7-dimethyl-8-ribityllumazine synthase [Chitinophagaceae bacterium]|nr:6,7-dimethyl-8-ribityllumazine synthase [Chitinophagaceae bacterium]
MARAANTGLLKTENPDIGNACVVVIRTEWNSAIVDELEKGCVDELQQHKVKKIITHTVPGAFEIPFAVLSFLQSATPRKRPDAFIALACVIRGETAHFDYVCKAVTEGVLQLNLSLPMPTIFGVLMAENEKQARDRAGGRGGHRGREAAITALKMISLNRSLKK